MMRILFICRWNICRGLIAEFMMKDLFKSCDYDRHGMLIGIDQTNLRNLHCICGSDTSSKMHLLMDFIDHPDDVTVPWRTSSGLRKARFMYRRFLYPPICSNLLSSTCWMVVFKLSIWTGLAMCASMPDSMASRTSSIKALAVMAMMGTELAEGWLLLRMVRVAV